MPRHAQAPINANFPGANYPVGSRVRFAHGGRTITGTVATLKRRQALVLADEERWNVPYTLLELVERPKSGECSLAETEALAKDLVKRHQAASGLAKGWRFGFDLAPSRAGVCRYAERRIDLSVSFCLAASRTEIIDTILHEIAHAIVGKGHNHDAVWTAKALEIGCTGARTHAVRHTAARWAGECGCGQRWFRQRLSRKVANGACCPQCRGDIRWRRNDGGLDAKPPR